MRTNLRRFLLGSVLTVAAAQVASAYTYIYSSTTNQPIKWMMNSVVMHVNMGTQPTTADTNRSQAVVAAINLWNANLSAVQLVSTVDTTPGTDHDHVNEIFFDTTVYGTSFGDSTLAITTTWSYSNNARSEADIVFNNNPTIIIPVGGTPTTFALTWDSYRGNQIGSSAQPNPHLTVDIRRVALHELGHVLGLNHPDQETDGSDPNVTAIMHSAIGDLDTLTADDLTGAQHLYGILGAGPPANDSFANATLVTLSDGTTYAGSNIYTNAASRETGEPLIVGNAGGHSVWWKWVAPVSGSTTIDTRGSFIDTMLGVYTGPTVSALTLIADNDDEAGAIGLAHHTSLVTFNAIGGTTYYIAVDGFYFNDGSGMPYVKLGDTGDIKLHVTQATGNVAPTVSNPANTTVNTGTSAQFTVTATGNPYPGLQWQRLPFGSGIWATLTNAGSYSGVNSTTLTVSGTTLGMSGDQFRCVATNLVSSATSAAATLTVITPTVPSITNQPVPATVNEGSNVSFSLTATSNNTAPTYVWQVYPAGGSSWSSLTDTGGYAGSATNTLSLANVSSALDGNQYRCVVTNSVGSTTSNGVLLTVIRPPVVLQLAAGRYHSLRLDASPNVLVTGTNTYGQLYNYTTTNRTTPQQITVGGGQLPIGIAAGAQHSVFLTSAGQVWSAGINANGQLGDGTLVANANGVQTTTNAVGIAAGLQHTAILKNDGSLWTLGGNDEGQLGTGSKTEVHAPVQIATNVADLATGLRQTLFIKSDGTLWVTGDFDGNTPNQVSPIQIATNVQAVAAGGYHSLFLKNDGTVWALGLNAFGQLGNGTTTDAHTPIQIATGVKAIATGYFHSLFIKTDNTLWSFGRNESGQLGDGTVANRSTPYQMATNVATVSASESYTLFTKLDGSLWGTGLNGNGQFGNGSVISVTSPVLIAGGALVSPGITGYVNIAANAAQDRINISWGINAFDSGYDVWRGTTGNFAAATRIASNLRWAFYQDANVTDNTTYYYWIVGVNPTGTSGPGSGGQYTYHLPVMPSFTAQPSNQSVNVGDTATFTVTAIGSPNPTLQWQRLPAGSGTWANVVFGGNYSLNGANTLMVYNATALMSGDQFRCVATSTLGTAISNAATLTVVVGSGPPVIVLQPLPVSVNTGGATSFTIAATGQGPMTYKWQIQVAGSSTWNDIDIIEIFTPGPKNYPYGGITTPSLALNFTVPAQNGSQFHCVVTNSLGTATSNGAMITVFSKPGKDFNADGKGDLVWQNTVTGDRYIWFMNGAVIAGVADLGVTSLDWRIAATGDLGGDGRAEIIWENTVTGDHYIWYMAGGTVTGAFDLGIVSTDWTISAAGDLNGDGNADLLWTNTVTGDRYIWFMNNNLIASAVDLGVIPTEWRLAAAGDLDGDTKGDIIWENTVTGDRYIWFMDGSTIKSAVDLGYISTDWTIGTASDLNGDGKYDLIWTNTATGDRYIWFMNGSTITSAVDLGIISTDWRIGN